MTDFKDRWEQIGWTWKDAYNNGPFVKVYADLKMYHILSSINVNGLLVFQCRHGYVTFGPDAELLHKRLGYSIRQYGTGILYVTFPTEDLEFVHSVFCGKTKIVRCVTPMQGEESFININKSRKPNFLLLASLFL